MVLVLVVLVVIGGPAAERSGPAGAGGAELGGAALEAVVGPDHGRGPAAGEAVAGTFRSSAAVIARSVSASARS